MKRPKEKTSTKETSKEKERKKNVENKNVKSLTREEKILFFQRCGAEIGIG